MDRKTKASLLNSTRKGLLPSLFLTFALNALPSVEAAPPPNDDFGNAAQLTGTFDTASGTTSGATREAGERGETGDNTVWYRWEAPSTGRARFSANATGQGFTHKRIVVWTPGGEDGSGNPVFVGLRDEYIGEAIVPSIPVMAGKVYYFCVGHYNLSFGNAPGAFDCAIVLDTNTDLNALNVVQASGSNSRFQFPSVMNGENVSAISYALEFPEREAGEPQWNPNYSSWWRWVASNDGMLTVSLRGTELAAYYASFENRTLAVYEVESFSEMSNSTPVGFAVANGGLPNDVRVPVRAGKSYYVTAGVGRLTSSGFFSGGTTPTHCGWRIVTMRYSKPRPTILMTSPGSRVGRSFSVEARIGNPQFASAVVFRVGRSKQRVATRGSSVVRSKRFRSRKARGRRTFRMSVLASVYEKGSSGVAGYARKKLRSKFRGHR